MASKKKVWTLCVALLPFSAFAQSVTVDDKGVTLSAPPASTSVRQESPIPLPKPAGGYLDEIIRMEAELEKINKQIAIRDASRKLNDEALPEVVSVILREGDAMAIVQYRSKMHRTVRVGDSVGEHGKIVAIDSAGVKVKPARGQTFYLPFYEQPSQQQQQQQQLGITPLIR